MKVKDLIELIKDAPEAIITVDGKMLNDYITETKQKGGTAKNHSINIQTLTSGNWDDR